jgi:hypothetical protein
LYRGPTSPAPGESNGMSCRGMTQRATPLTPPAGAPRCSSTIPSAASKSPTPRADVGPQLVGAALHSRGVSD